MAKRRNDATGEEIEDNDEQIPEAKREPTEAEQRAAQRETEENPDLVKMRRGDETLHVHRMTVEEHRKLGWKHAEE